MGAAAGEAILLESGKAPDAAAASARPGINPEEVRMASRSRKGYWRMSGNGLVQRALSKRWLEEQGVPELRSRWIALHYGEGREALAN